MNKRLEMLQKMIETGKADSFARYALGMELRREGRVDAAIRAFEDLRSVDADYLPMYLMAGQTLIEAERKGDARPWLEQGLALATRKNDGKARNELEAALSECD